jgi:hypothetical protein
MQESAAATMPRIARRSDARAAIAPMACAANVITGWVGKKDIGAPVSTLGSTFQPTARGGQRSEIGIVIHDNQDVRVLWILLILRQGADDSDSANTMTRASAFHETQDFVEQEVANRGIGVCRVQRHFVVPNVRGEARCAKAR